MKRPLRHLNALRAFEAAARHSSFAKAALDLNVSHSVVSQHIKNLEEWFGTELFIRYGNRIELSEDGKTLIPHVASAFEMLRDACDNLLHLSRVGTVVVSAEPAISSHWLRRKITEFCAKYPKIEVDLKPAWRPPELGEDHADVVIHFEQRLSVTGGVQERLFPIDGFPACSPELYHEVKFSDHLANFSHLPLVHDNGRHIWYHWFAQFTPDSNQWEEGKVYSDLALAIDAAVDGEGIFLADDILCEKEMKAGQLVQLDDRKIRCTWYRIAIEEDTPTHSPVAAFRNWVLKSSAEVSYDHSLPG